MSKKVKGFLEGEKEELFQKIETAKKEAVLLSEKVAQEAEAEIEGLEKAFEDRVTIERRKMQRVIVCEILDEMFKEGSISLDNDEIVKIVNKKVA